MIDRGQQDVDGRERGHFSERIGIFSRASPPNLRTCRRVVDIAKGRYNHSTSDSSHSTKQPPAHPDPISIMFSQATRSLLRAAPVARNPVSVCARTAFSTYTANSLISRMSQMSLARPVASPTKSLVAFQQTRGMKVRSSVKKLCDGCKVRDKQQQTCLGKSR